MFRNLYDLLISLAFIYLDGDWKYIGLLQISSHSPCVFTKSTMPILGHIFHVEEQ